MQRRFRSTVSREREARLDGEAMRDRQPEELSRGWRRDEQFRGACRSGFRVRVVRWNWPRRKTSEEIELEQSPMRWSS